MKQETLETVVVVTKVFCAFTGPALLGYSVSVGQWANAPDSPSALEWSMIIGGSLGTGIMGLGSFMSSAFGKWVQSRSSIDITNGSGGMAPPVPLATKP